MRQIGARADVLIATGGSDVTRRILPAIGFRPYGDVCTFARPVRPLTQALTTPEKNWRLPARLLRNTFWRLLPPLSFPRGWSAMPLAPDAVPERLWPRPSDDTAVTARDADFYRYVVASPCARHALFGLEKNGELAGYFCLAFAPRVARVADLWLPFTSADDWRAGFRCAAAVAASEPDVCEVSAWASTDLGKGALAGAGFRLRDRASVSISGERSVLGGRALHVQMLDCDASFLSDAEVSYLT